MPVKSRGSGSLLDVFCLFVFVFLQELLAREISWHIPFPTEAEMKSASSFVIG
jgi:hypothetical protein